MWAPLLRPDVLPAAPSIRQPVRVHEMSLAYFCETCNFYYYTGWRMKHCPECKGAVKPRLIMGGQVMGSPPKEGDATPP